ncbi:MAG: hypothetical protein CL869_05120, partial [Cytophagia bacterium]|nr:hypothetical protein [Cytophagia bacterium]
KNNFNYQIIGRGFFKTFLKFYKIAQNIRINNPECLFCFGHQFLTIFSIFLFPVSHKELSIHCHHGDFRSKLLWKIYYFIAKRAFNSITFSSSIMLNQALRIYPKLNEVAYINRTILSVPKENLKKFENNLFEKNVIIVGGLGWFIKRKRFDLFINLAKLLLEESNKFRFKLAGDGPLKSELKARASLFGIDDFIEWCGLVEDTKIFYKSIDILVYFTDVDAFPIVPLEAMANNVPVLASTKFSDLNQVLENKKHCFIQDNHDLNLLVNQISLLINDYKLVNRFNESTKKLLQNEFSAKSYFSKFEERIKTS